MTQKLKDIDMNDNHLTFFATLSPNILEVY